MRETHALETEQGFGLTHEGFLFVRQVIKDRRHPKGFNAVKHRIWRLINNSILSPEPTDPTQMARPNQVSIAMQMAEKIPDARSLL
jgi:hypothetical protein